MFKEMEEAFKEQVASLIGTITPQSASSKEESNESQEIFVTSQNEASGGNSTTSGASGDVSIGKEPGRNDPCPCGAINPGTGEVYKYKKCGMINAPQHRKALVN